MITCNTCRVTVKVKATKTGLDRVPIGWKRRGETAFCRKCWQAKYVLRAITLPVAFPSGRKTIELWQELAEAWKETTRLSNWTVTELAKADITMTKDLKKLPAMPGVYLYPGARRLCPDLNPQSVTSILRAVEMKYRKRRYEVLWQSACSLPNYRYPVPYPIHNQGWKLRTAGGAYLVQIRLKGEPWEIQLRGGREFYRQARSMDQIISGDAVQGELAFLRAKANAGDHRSGGDAREDGDRKRWRIMCKIVAWLPRQVRKEKRLDGALRLSTAHGQFWVAEHPDLTSPWVINGDCARAWAAGYAHWKMRAYEDRRPERRRVRRYDQVELTRRAEKHRNRIKSFSQMLVASLARLAEKLGVSEVHYDDSERGYIDSFPWYQLNEMLRVKLDEIGVQLVPSSPMAEETVEALAEKEANAK